MTALPHITIDEALTDRHLLGAALGDLESWSTWRAILKAAFALPLDAAERAVFDRVAGDRAPPTHRVAELWVIAGRRGGKSRMAGALCAYLASFSTYPLAPGETASVIALAVSKVQAKPVLDYASAFLTQSPILRQLVDGEPTTEEIRLKGNIVIGVSPANFRTVRSRSLIGAVFDETAYWRDVETSTNPDEEIYTATLPALATAGGMLVGISSPYRRAGLLFKKHERSFGRDDPDVLVVKAPSLVLNPSLVPDVIERARAMDPDKARSEWDAEFRDDISDFLTRSAVMACVEAGVRERPPNRERLYAAFCDPSGGASHSMTLAIAHKEGVTAVLDAVREVRPPFNPESVVAEFAGLLRSYRISTVRGDRYAGEWVVNQFRNEGVHYEHTERSKSDLYLDLLPAVNAGAVALLENDRLVAQLVALERRAARSGRDFIDHPPGGHDDVANAVAGALVGASTARTGRRPRWTTTVPAESPYAELNRGYRPERMAVEPEDPFATL